MIVYTFIYSQYPLGLDHRLNYYFIEAPIKRLPIVNTHKI